MGKRQGIMLCYPFEEKRLDRWGVSHVIVQPKLDGERCRAIIDNGEVQLLSSEINEILSVPHINESLSKMFPYGHYELDGELYLHGMSFPDIHGIVSRKENIHSEYDSMQFHIFDMIAESIQVNRTLVIEDLTPPTKAIQIVRSKVVQSTTSDILRAMKEFTEQNYEGIIIRHPYSIYERKRSTFIMKFKPKREDIYQIIGYKQLVDKNKNPREELGAFICTSDEGTIFSVGSGLTQLQREMFWLIRDKLAGNHLRIQYQHTEKGAPRFPIFMEIINTNPAFIF